MHRVLSALFVVVLLLGMVAQAGAAATPNAPNAGTVSLTGGTYTENFDTLASTGTSGTTPNGWAFSETGNSANTTYAAGTGSSNTGDTYSFGAASSSERAFGGVLSSNLVPTVGAQFQNSRSETITSLSIDYNCEQWRAGQTGSARTDRLDFQYSTNATSFSTGTWTDVNDLDCSGVVPGDTAGRALDGNTNRTVVSGSFGSLSITAGAYFWIRWTDFNATGSDDGLSVDDFNLTPTFDSDDAPSVDSTSPASDAVNVSRTANVSITFSEAVNVTTSSFTIGCANSGAHTYALSGSGTATTTLNPADDFEGGELCTVTVVATQVSDVDGNDPPDTMEQDFEFSFTTISADEAPSVATTTPTNGATGIGTAANIGVTFSEAVNVTGAWYGISCGASGSHSAAVTGGPTAFTLNPDVNFSPAETCTVTVYASGVADQDTNDPPENMATDYLFSFTTDAAPSVFSTTPASNATGIASSDNVNVTFSEAVNVASGWYTISCATSGSHSATVTGGPTTFTINPDSDFANAEECTITVNAALVTDADADDPPDAMAADVSWSFTTAAAVATNVIINELDSDTPGTDAAEFVELYDGGAGSTSLTGLVVVFYNGSTDLSYAAYDLDGYATGADGYFLLGNADVAPTPGIIFAGNWLQNGPDAVALYAGNATDFPNNTAVTTANLVDAIVYDTADEDDAGLLVLLNAGQPQVDESSNADSANESNQRCPNGSGGARNTSTYSQGTPTAGATNDCPDDPPFVASTVPANDATAVALSADVSITFSEPVNVTGAWYSISCSASGAHAAAVTGGPTTFTLNPGTDFVAGDVCTATVVATQVTDQDSQDPPDAMQTDYAFIFTTDNDVCALPATPVHTIQGSGTASLVAGQSKTIMGYVVADFQSSSQMSGFFVQEELGDWDADATTSEGIFVYQGSTSVADLNVGDKVRLTGTVSEYADRTAGGATMTQLSSPRDVTVCSTGNTVTPVDITLPETTDGDLERYEGMLVRVTTTMTVVDNYYLGRYGQLGLSGDGRLYIPTNQYPAGSAEALALADHNARAWLTLDDGVIDVRCGNNPNPVPYLGAPPPNVIRSGDTVTNLTGVLDYGQIDSTANGDSCTTATATFGGNYRLQPTVAPVFAAANPRPVAPTATADIKVVGANLLNWFNGDGNKGGFPTSRGATTFIEFVRQRVKLYEELSQLNADVVTLMELENDGFGTTSAIAELVTVLNSGPCWNSATECATIGYSASGMGAGTYAFVNLGGTVGTDEITVGIIYKPARVNLAGTPAVLTATGYTDPNNTGTQKSRPAVAASFKDKATSAVYTVVANHLKSKGSCPTGGVDADQNDGQGCWNDTRTKGAKYLVNTWLPSHPTSIAENAFLLMGDMNAYAHEDPILAFETAGYVDLINTHIGSGAYSYAFDAGFGYLDHALASPALASHAVSAAEWHNNADEPPVIDYDTEYNQAAAYYTPNAYRASDHDPVLVGLTSDPLAVDLAAFTATPNTGAIELAWETNAEQDNAGFDVLRAESAAGPWTRLNPSLIAAVAPGAPGGHSYRWTDATAVIGVTYWYKLESVDLSGARQASNPVSAKLSAPTAVSVRALRANTEPALLWPLALLLPALALLLRRKAV